jgi:hypothetical protein
MAKKPTRNKTKTKITLSIPDFLPSQSRGEIGNRIIDFITERTLAGQNVYGRKWSGKAGEYTKAYAKKKGQTSPVDLELDGDMLAAMKTLTSKKGSITIGYEKGTKDERKAEGNIRGTYGQPSPIPGKARPFLDILKKDLQNILDEYIEDAESLAEELEDGNGK